jgi:hypothetical protein
MTPTPLPRDATSQPVTAAGIAAVALAMLVAIVVAALFLVLIGAHRSDQAALIITAPPPAVTTPAQPAPPPPPPVGTALATRDALSDLASRPTGVRPDNNSRIEGENQP